MLADAFDDLRLFGNKSSAGIAGSYRFEVGSFALVIDTVSRKGETPSAFPQRLGGHRLGATDKGVVRVLFGRAP